MSTYPPSTDRVVAADYHRNGIAGRGFYVGIIRDTDEGKRLIVHFPGDDCAIAVLNVDDIGNSNVYMHPQGALPGTGNAAFRGDHFTGWAKAVEQVVNDRWDAQHAAMGV